MQPFEHARDADIGVRRWYLNCELSEQQVQSSLVASDRKFECIAHFRYVGD